MRIKTIFFLLAFTLPLPGEYKNLFLAENGPLYVQTPADPYSINGPVVEKLNEDVVDVNRVANVVATASLRYKYCGFAGSRCFILPDCVSNYTIRGPQFDVSLRVFPLLRLNARGSLAWIDTQVVCSIFSEVIPAPIHGLYDIRSFAEIAPANGARLANLRTGRRLITADDRALTFSGPQLQWRGETGVQSIPHVRGAFEAVTDASGANIVYVEYVVGEMHWVAGETDEDLGFTGSAPALAANGRSLFFLNTEGALQSYDRESRTVRRVTEDTYLEFTLGENSVFAVTTGGSIVRIGLDDGSMDVLLDPMPEIASSVAPAVPGPMICPQVCYYTKPPQSMILTPGKTVILNGVHFDQPGWILRYAGIDMPLYPLSPQSAWFRVPDDVPASFNAQPASLLNPAHPIQFPLVVQVQQGTATP